MCQPGDWANLELGAGARLLLGWRGTGNRLDASPVDLSDDIGEEMLSACRRQLDEIGERRRREFAGVPALEADEYLTLAVGNSRGANDSADRQVLSEEELAAADVVALVRGAFEDDDFLTRDDLEAGGWLFYIVVAELADDGVLGFVRPVQPATRDQDRPTCCRFPGHAKEVRRSHFQLRFRIRRRSGSRRARDPQAHDI